MSINPTGGHSVPRRPRPKPKPKPAPPPTTAQRDRARQSLGFNPEVGSFRGTQKPLAARARQAAPARPMPRVPRIPNPTPEQTRAAQQQIAAGINRQVTGKTPRERAASRRRVIRDIQNDPRLADVRRASAYYARVGERQTAETVARAMGVRGGSRGDRIRAGRQLIGWSIARNPGAKPGVKAPHKKVGLGPATIDLTSAATRLVGATSLNTGDLGPRQFVGKVGRDIRDLSVGPFVGGYELGAGVVDLARGKGAGRLERLGKGIAEGTYETFRHPIRSFEEHPLLTALTFGGAASVASRTAGAVARGAGSTAEAGGIRGALARAGSTVRSPLAMGDDAGAPIMERSFSKDLGRKVVQAERDRLREPLRRPDGSIVTHTDARGRTMPVLKASVREREKMAKKAADNVASRANSVERYVRDRANHEMQVRGVKGKRAKDLVSMVVEGTITSSKNFEADLRTHRRRIAAALENGDHRHSGVRKAAEERLAMIDKALASPKVMRQAPQIVAAGEQIGRTLNELEGRATQLGILNPTRAARSRLVVPAVEHMGARHFTPDELKGLEDVAAQAEKHGQLRHADGRFLSNAEIEKALLAKGRDPATVAYLPHRLDVRGRRAFHSQFRPGARGTLDKPEMRTGSAYAKGATEASAELVREQGARLHTHIAKAEQLDRLISDYGMKHPDGRYFTAKEALEIADRLEEDTRAGGNVERLVPVSAFPAKAGELTREAALELQNPKTMESLGQRLLNDRIVTEPGHARNVVLMPASMVERLQEHLKPAGGVERLFQIMNRPFRMAVLPQPRWLTGNFVEPFLVRLPGVGSGVNVLGLGADLHAARKVLKTMERSRDPKVRAAAQEIRAQQLGGLFIGGGFKRSVRREAREAIPGKPGEIATFMRNVPAVKQAIDLAMLLPNAIFALNRRLETVVQKAALGHQVRRDMQEFTGSWSKTVVLQRKAAEQAARGLTNTATQRRFMAAQHELLGKYEGFNPLLRRTVNSVAPFLPWSLNSARFVFWTMPAHRTAQTALLLQTQQAVSQAWADEHADVPPGSLKYAVPNGRGGFVDAIRYTPWGLNSEVAGGGRPDQLLGLFFPQLQGPTEAIRGRDPFGRELSAPKTASNPKGKVGVVGSLGVAGNEIAESMIPYVAQIRRLREKGGTAYSTSTVFSPQVKPGTEGQMSAVRRTYDPFRPTYLRNPTGGGKAGGGLDKGDLKDIQDAVRDASSYKLDKSDVEDIRQALRDLGYR